MSSISRTQLARGYVSLLGKYPATRLNLVLAHYVVTNKMTNQVDLLLKDINQELLRQHGRLDVEVVALNELNETIKHDLIDLIKTKTGAKQVHLHTTLDKSILGGLIAETPEHVFDFSLATKLQELHA